MIHQRIVFLDVDGPLANARVHLGNCHIGGVWEEWDSLLCKFLRINVCMMYGYKIVISSTWRHARPTELFERLNNPEYSKLMDFLVEDAPFTPRKYGTDGTRWHEIAEWLKYHPYVGDDYLIIDDEESACPRYLRDTHLIKADPHDGILIAQYRKMRTILNDRHSNT